MAGTDHRAYDVLVMVGSAGALDVFVRVLSDLPDALPVPVVLAQHLGPGGSRLPEILSRQTGRDVVWASEGAVLRDGEVVVAPARTVLEVLPDASCELREADGTSARSFDVLLGSVATTYGARGLVVILTGLASDGAAGARAVSDAGGTVLVQDPETAEQAGMPEAAIATGACDLVLPLHELGATIGDVLGGAPLPASRADVATLQGLFRNEPELLEVALQRDWSATPLGPVGGWPAILRSTLRQVVRSPTPQCLLWGPELVQLYNGAYRSIMGAKHPGGLGQANRDCWPEVWHLNEPRYARVLQGEPWSQEQALYPITRHGELEDAWFDIAFVPVEDEAGEVAGILCTTIERSTQVLADRRLATLHAVATATPGARDRSDALSRALGAIDAAHDDVPFALGYLFDVDRQRATLGAAAGADPGDPVAAQRVASNDRSRGWPLRRAVSATEPLLVDDVAARFPDAGDLPGGARRALVMALRDPAEVQPVAALVVGLNPRLPFDQPYRSFLRLLSAGVEAALGEAHSQERERQRTDRLAELDQMRREFFTNVSHEFRTPVTLMLGPLEELSRNEGVPAHLREDAQLAERNGQRLLRLVGTLLDYSQSEAGELQPQPEPTDLAALSRAVAAPFAPVAQQAGLALVVDAPAGTAPVQVDRSMWEKVLSHLLSNALKHTFEGAITVTVGDRRNHAEVTVTDTGVGIPRAALPDLFKRFHRVRGTAGRSAEGAGIGLALANDLVRRHSGRIRVRSTPGAGTTFTVWLPRGRRHEDPSATPVAPVGQVAFATAMAAEAAGWNRTDDPAGAVDPRALPVEPIAGLDVAGATVLVADDNADMRTYVERLLAPTFRVVVTGDGREALDTARRVRPDLVVADMQMPGLGGLELLRAIREDGDLNTAPVILITARADEADAVEGLVGGADDYLLKPFSPRELLARVGAQIALSRTRLEHERRLTALINASWDVVYRMSPRWTEMRALDGQGFLADTTDPDERWIDGYIPESDRSEVLAAIEHAIETRSTFELRHRVMRADESIAWTLSRAVPIVDGDGRILEWIGAATDLGDADP